MKQGAGYSYVSVDLNGIYWNGDRVLKVQGRFNKSLKQLHKHKFSVEFFGDRDEYRDPVPKLSDPTSMYQ